MAADKDTAKNGPGRDSGGRFVPGCTGGPGRPKGSANSLLTQARAWVEERGLPLMIEAAEAGDADALVDLCRARVGAVNVARAPRLPDELFELN